MHCMGLYNGGLGNLLVAICQKKSDPVFLISPQRWIASTPKRLGLIYYSQNPC